MQEVRSALSHVSLTGVRAAADTSRPTPRRVLWLCLLSLCFAVMLAQITDRVQHFISEPVAVLMRVSRNTSLIFPAVTICNKNEFNLSAIHEHLLNKTTEVDVAELLSLPGVDASRAWHLARHHRSKLIKECWFGRNVTCASRGSWESVATTMGICHTFTLNDSLAHLAGVFHNLYLKLEETEHESLYNSDPGWKVLFDDPGESAALRAQTHGSSVYFGQGRDIRLELKKVQALPHATNPCIDEPMYRQSECFDVCFVSHLIKENVTCGLPYMKDSPLPSCSTPKSYRETQRVVERLFFYGHWRPETCACPQRCEQTIFTTALESITDKYKRSRERPQLARIRLYFRDLQYEHVREVSGYGGIDLLCDIGGTLSLLMGASLLSCCELFEICGILVALRCSKRRNTNQGNDIVVENNVDGVVIRSWINDNYLQRGETLV